MSDYKDLPRPPSDAQIILEFIGTLAAGCLIIIVAMWFMIELTN